MGNRFSSEIADYLADHHVMTLATQGEEGPWASAVFYAWVDGALVFLSSPDTRHARNLAGDSRCAASIQDDTGDWKAVKGIQLEGRVQRLDGEEAVRTRSAYAKKYPLVSPVAVMPTAIAEALAKVVWYRLRPEKLYFIDNSRGFGHRDEFGFQRD